MVRLWWRRVDDGWSVVVMWTVVVVVDSRPALCRIRPDRAV